MRSFIITLVLLIVLISAIIANAFYINTTMTKIMELTEDENFKKAPEAALLQLESFWENNKTLIEFSTGYKSTDRISELMLDLREYVQTNNPAEERRVRMLIADCVSDISKLESLSIENLL